ncbi:hypothetical protein IHE55_00815 [Streptomyces pactum]|uniref:Uncharacterized protein n=1 Tax=Streptomyces pactum TaxID=68249 RepID=A0ABS0NDZ8_9ACTN|nr:hypothetical protein [Streptomyces pactum]MBH5333419.1 hypothetical protein [Streptomyces pactum]
MASYVWGSGRTGYGPHRLAKILARPARAMAAATGQLATAGIGWPSAGGPDLLELALFEGAWGPAARRPDAL